MNIKESKVFLGNLGLNISESALRRLLRNNDLLNVTKDSNKEGWDIPKKSLIEYAITQGKISTITAYKLGYEQGLEKYKNECILRQGHQLECFLFSALCDCYHLIVTNAWEGYNSFYIKIDEEKKIIHMFDSLQIAGTSLINLISSWLIKEILIKAKIVEKEDEIYDYSAIIYTRGYSTFELYNQDISFFSAEKKEFKFKKFTNIDIIKNADFKFVEMLPNPQEYLVYEKAKNMLEHCSNETINKVLNLSIPEIEEIRLEFEK